MAGWRNAVREFMFGVIGPLLTSTCRHPLDLKCRFVVRDEKARQLLKTASLHD
jgi:hypothetical protein